MPTPPPTPPNPAPHDPLHGITLERIINELAEYFGWEGLNERIPLRCFGFDPSVSSSLKFLRRTPWAREKVESLYLYMLREKARRADRVDRKSRPRDNQTISQAVSPRTDADC